MGWIAIHGGEEGWAVPPSTPPPAVDDDAEPLPRPSPESLPRSMLPPSLEIETVDITVRSAWSRPVVSAMLRGITVIVVVRKGEFPLVNHRGIDGTSLLFGDMPDELFLVITDMTLGEVTRLSIKSWTVSFRFL